MIASTLGRLECCSFDVRVQWLCTSLAIQMFFGACVGVLQLASAGMITLFLLQLYEILTIFYLVTTCYVFRLWQC